MMLCAGTTTMSQEALLRGWLYSMADLVATIDATRARAVDSRGRDRYRATLPHGFRARAAYR